MAESQTGLAEFEALARARRTVKPQDFDLEKPLERELLERCLECACWAPTHGMTEPWRLRVFRGEARRELGEALEVIYLQITPPQQQVEAKREKMRTQPLLAQAVIALGVAVGPQISAAEEEQAVACAAQNFWLAAAAAGLGVSWSSPPVTGSAEFVNWLGLGPEDRCLGLLYLGWPRSGLALATRRRRARAERVSWYG